MIKNKGEESLFLLNVIDPTDFSLSQCIKIISKFSISKLCLQISKLFKEENNLPERNYVLENELLKKELDTLKKSREDIPLEQDSKIVRKKPFFFESDIFQASSKGKLDSIKYLYEYLFFFPQML